MSTHTAAGNKDIVRRLYAAFLESDLEQIDALLASDFRAHGLPPGCSPDAEGRCSAFRPPGAVSP